MRMTTFGAAVGRRLVIAALVPMLAMGVVAAIQLSAVQAKAVDWRNRLMAESVRAETEAYLSAPLNALSQFRGIEDTRVVSELIRSSAANVAGVESIEMLDESGVVIAAGFGSGVEGRLPDRIGLDRSRDRQYTRASVSRRPAWSGVFASTLSGASSIELAVPLDGGIALVTMRVEALAGATTRSALEPDAVVVILDSTGSVLFHSTDALAAQRPNWGNIPPVADGIAGRTGSYRYVLDGEDMLGSTALIPGAGWIVLVQQDWRDARAPIMGVVWWIGIAAVVVALIAIAAAALFARALTAPIDRLTRFTGRVKQGEYEADPGEYHHREMARLARSIGEMSTAVHERESDLAESRAHLEQSNLNLRDMLHATAEAMGRIVEARDPYTQGHQERVGELASAIAIEMGLSEHEVEGIATAAIIHDIGKLSVPAEILTKPGRISANEFALIKQHPETGYAVLHGIAFPWPIAEVVRQHHERMDGSGYPRGLAGSDILVAARIIAVADTVEAMASNRPYRAALGLEAAIAEVQDDTGRFDPSVVAALLRLHEAGRITL